MCRKHGLLERIPLNSCLFVSLGAFAVVSVLNPAGFLSADAAISLVGALSGVLTCAFAAMLLEEVPTLAKPLSYLGEHLACIYLISVPFTWFVAVIVFKKLEVSGAASLWGLPLAVALGLAMPRLIEKLILRCSNVLSLAVLGVELRTAPAPDHAPQRLPDRPREPDRA